MRIIMVILLCSILSSTSFAAETVDYVDLVRHAWQQTYAPKHLQQTVTPYARTPIAKKFTPHLIYGHKVIAYPLASWTAGDRYVTAILLRNPYPHPIQLNIHNDICGAWQAATIYPITHLKPYGKRDGDTTTLFLVSKRPFKEAVGTCHGHA